MFKISEIFTSIDGEVNQWGQGRLTTFVRFSGCNLVPRCLYCDTRYASEPGAKGIEMSMGDLIGEIKRIGCPNLTLTGGEPLIQEGIWDLLRTIRDDYNVSVETNGTMIMFYQGERVGYVADYKLHCPEQMNLDSMSVLTPKDWLKFVITNREDFGQALEAVDMLRRMACRARMAFSPVRGQNEGPDHADLINWLRDAKRWDITVNIQLHKLINVK